MLQEKNYFSPRLEARDKTTFEVYHLIKGSKIDKEREQMRKVQFFAFKIITY